jgi:hypothetical protein
VLLRVTRAALGDLGLDESFADQPAERLVDEHPVIRAFVERRSQSPTGQEVTYLPVTKLTVYNLHSGTARGLTWHDDVDGVVWLLGVAWHRGGSNSDAYDELKARDSAGWLFPSDADFEGLEPPAVPFVEACAHELPALLERATAAPGDEVRAVIGAALDVGLLVEVVVVEADELTETWVSIALPPQAGAVLPPEYVTVVLAALFPDADASDFRWDGSFPASGPRPSSEIVLSYCR